MARTEAKLKVFGLTQYLDPSYWQWTDDEKQMLQYGAQGILGVIDIRFRNSGLPPLESLYGIVHDKDEIEVFDEATQSVVKQLKPPHIHAVFRGTEPVALLSELAKVIGVEVQYVEKPERGRYAHGNMISYLTHAKYPEKFQYDPSEVFTQVGPSYLGIDTMQRSKWLAGRAALARKRATEGVDELWEKCFSGELTRAQVLLTDEYARIYAQNKRRIDDALDSYGQRRALIAAEALKNGEFETTVVFVTGEAGSGKTRFALELVASQIEAAASRGERWNCYEAASSNPMDDWSGEEVLLLDDLRPASMSAADWLKLLDNHNASPASARYQNKSHVAPRLIVVTASIEPLEFFYYTRQRGNVDETMDQFIRRLAAIVTVIRKDDAAHYRIDRVGRIEPQQRRMITSRGLDEFMVKHGVVETIFVNTQGVASEVIQGEVAQRSPDLELTGANWNEYPQLLHGLPGVTLVPADLKAVRGDSLAP